MFKPTVAYSTFCCSKDRARVLERQEEHRNSHGYPFDEMFLIFQRCEVAPFLAGTECGPFYEGILEKDYPKILNAFGIKNPDPVLDELTHGWNAPHYWQHHMVNHLKTVQSAKSDYIVFADGDCYIKEQVGCWVDVAIGILQTHPEVFVVSPNDGGQQRHETIMSQQMFLVNRKRFLEMEFIPWDGKFIEGGPFQEYYGLLEGWIARYMAKNKLSRYVLGPEYRYWHLEWH